MSEPKTNFAKTIAKNKTVVSMATGAASLAYLTGNQNVVVPGVGSVPNVALGAVLGGATSMITDYIVSMIVPYVSDDKKLQNQSSLVLHILSAGGSFAAIPMALYGNLGTRNDYMTFFKAGVISEVVSQGIHEYACKQMGGCDDAVFYPTGFGDLA